MSEPNADNVNNWILDLLSVNPELTGGQARGFARRIVLAEEREDYIEMNAVIQEALFGPSRHPAAA